MVASGKKDGRAWLDTGGARARGQWVFLAHYFGLSSLRWNPKINASMWALFKEFLRFCRQEKKWWLIPLIVLLLVLGAILIFTATSGIAWALYPFM